MGSRHSVNSHRPPSDPLSSLWLAQVLQFQHWQAAERVTRGENEETNSTTITNPDIHPLNPWNHNRLDGLLTSDSDNSDSDLGQFIHLFEQFQRELFVDMEYLPFFINEAPPGYIECLPTWKYPTPEADKNCSENMAAAACDNITMPIDRKTQETSAGDNSQGSSEHRKMAESSDTSSECPCSQQEITVESGFPIGFKDSGKCVICLEDYVAEEILCGLPCAHSFHFTCIKQWLTEGKHSCPVCRKSSFASQ